MRKATLLKLVFALGIGAASLLGLLHVAAEPAYAYEHCPYQRPGYPGGSCTLSGYEVYGDIVCCVYYCSNGNYLEGPCAYI